MDDVTALRDALVNDAIWVNANRPKNVGEWRARLDALIAAVEARAALTPERLAKALSKVFACGEVSTVDGSVGLDTVASMLLAALATDEAVP